jgi:hypothetical protein
LDLDSTISFEVIVLRIDVVVVVVENEDFVDVLVDKPTDFKLVEVVDW